jgi:carbamoyl-phosphate synthase small subunit
MDALLVLDDGTIVHGRGLGSEGVAFGEIVFNTAMVGYVNAITDPSYRGQILMMTYPLIGNYGYSPDWRESTRAQIEGFVVRELCKHPSHPRSVGPLDEFLSEQGIPGIEGVDTRALTKRIRVHGTMKAALAVGEKLPKPTELQERVRAYPAITEIDLVPSVSRKEPVSIEAVGDLKLVLVDCGVKRSIVESVTRRGVSVTLVPFDTPAERILDEDPDGVLISNGPGDPARVKETIAISRKLLGKLPLFGICLGHQLLALACGAKTFKLKFGHRGINHPVKDLKSGRVFISSQNHGFAAEKGSLEKTGLEATQISLNDGTVEGLKHRELPLMSVQYHPEASPGPRDTQFFFDELVELMRSW